MALRICMESKRQNEDILTNQQVAQPKSVGNTVSDIVVNGEPPVTSRRSQCKQSKKETESVSNKQRELRQLDLKLRKWEEN